MIHWHARSDPASFTWSSPSSLACLKTSDCKYPRLLRFQTAWPSTTRLTCTISSPAFHRSGYSHDTLDTRDWPWLRHHIMRPMMLCGRRSLKVFCVGIFLSFVARFARTHLELSADADIGERRRNSYLTAVAWVMSGQLRSTCASAVRPRPW